MGSPIEDNFNDSLSQSLLPEQKAKKRDKSQVKIKRVIKISIMLYNSPLFNLCNNCCVRHRYRTKNLVLQLQVKMEEGYHCRYTFPYICCHYLPYCAFKNPIKEISEFFYNTFIIHTIYYYY